MPRLDRAIRRDEKRKNEPRRNGHMLPARAHQHRRSANMRLAASYRLASKLAD